MSFLEWLDNSGYSKENNYFPKTPVKNISSAGGCSSCKKKTGLNALLNRFHLETVLASIKA